MRVHAADHIRRDSRNGTGRHAESDVETERTESEEGGASAPIYVIWLYIRGLVSLSA